MADRSACRYRQAHKVFMTVLLLAGLRIFYSIPTPGVNTAYFKEMAEASQTLGFMDLISGNGISGMSIMALNVTPYITASIFIQLLSNVSERLHDMQQGMKKEQKKIQKWTIAVGILLAFAEGSAVAFGYGRKGLLINDSWYAALLAAGSWTAGSAACIFAGKKIQDQYQWNGISLILLCNILSTYPDGICEIYRIFLQGKDLRPMLVTAGSLILLVFLLFFFTYILQETEKDLPVQYSERSGKTVSCAGGGVFPIRLCPGGVVSVIFASTILSIPGMLAGVFVKTEAFWVKLLSSDCWFDPTDPLPTLGVLLYAVLIYGFSCFYADTSLNPHEIAETLKQSGATVAGIRPGKATERYLKRQRKGMLVVGSCGLTCLSLLPILLSGFYGLSRISFLGTSVIITVGVITELKKSFLADAKSGQYAGRKKRNGGLF